MERVILHSDGNNFYASIECSRNPELWGKPVAVCGDVELRHGIVLAKNMPAKNAGVKTGQAIWQAKLLCPELFCVPPHFDLYLAYSRLLRNIYADYTDQIEPFGLDEAWLDVTGSTRYGTGGEIAETIRQRVKDELGITVSIGVSFNKIYAKIGSDYKKPDAVTVISRDNYKEKVYPLPVGDLLYVGPATQKRLKNYGVHTIGQLAELPEELLESWFGKMGLVLHMFAAGSDSSPVSLQGAPPIVKSIGNSTTAPRDLTTDNEVRMVLINLCESVSERMRDINVYCETVQISVRTLRNNVSSGYVRQKKLSYPTCTTLDILSAAYDLYCSNHRAACDPIRTIGVRTSDLLHLDMIQLSILPQVQRTQRQEDLERSVDWLRRRFGTKSIQRGIALADTALSTLDAKREHVIHPVSYF